ncbi:MAG: PAS domain S-box protein, partial [Candidatus Aminicenantes bacterium]|nr:PAS domain S-box protein [Candidatus Aminicenantes bacterium]
SRIEAKLQESEKKYRTLFESSSDAIMMLAPPNWLFTAGNPATIRMFKAKDEKEFASKDPWELSPEYQPDRQLSSEKAKKMIEKAMKTGSHFFEWTHKRLDGKDFPATVLLTRIELEGKNSLQATVRDITERKHAEEELRKHRDHLEELVEKRTSDLKKQVTERIKAEEQLKDLLKEKEVLLKEVHHRVKNNFMIVISLLNLQSQNVKDKQTREMFLASQNRVRSMALVHQRLYESKDLANINFGNYLKKLITDEANLLGVDPARVSIVTEVEDVFLGIDFAIPCGLIVNELVSNSMKHSFPSSYMEKGEIKIIFRKIKDNKMELIISDNGIGIPKDLDIRKTESLGLKLVYLLAENQLGAKIRLDRNKGTKFQIIFSSP